MEGHTIHVAENMLMSARMPLAHTQTDTLVSCTSLPSLAPVSSSLSHLLDCSLFPHTHLAGEGSDSTGLDLPNPGQPCSPSPWLVAPVWQAALTQGPPQSPTALPSARAPTWFPSHPPSRLAQVSGNVRAGLGRGQGRIPGSRRDWSEGFPRVPGRKLTYPPSRPSLPGSCLSPASLPAHPPAPTPQGL